MPQNAKPKTHGTKAAIKAGYSAKSARTTAAEYLAKPNIQKAMTEQAIDEMLERKHAKNNHKKSQKKHGQK